MAEIEDVIEAIEDLKTDIMDKLDDILEKDILSRICHHCGGDGIKETSGESIECPDCNGEGLHKIGKIKSEEE